MKRLIDKKKEAITMTVTELNIMLEEGFNQIFGDIMDNPVLKEIEKDNDKND